VFVRSFVRSPPSLALSLAFNRRRRVRRKRFALTVRRHHRQLQLEGGPLLLVSGSSPLRRLLHLLLLLLLVLVQALLGQLARQFATHDSPLELGPTILEPHLDLGAVQAQLGGQLVPPLLGQVSAVFRELPLQPLQLLQAEGSPRPLRRLLLLRVLPPPFPLSGSCGRANLSLKAYYLQLTL